MKRESEYESLMWDRWAAEIKQLLANPVTGGDMRARMAYTRRLIELTQFLKRVDIAISLQQHLPPSDGYAIGDEAERAAAIHGELTPRQLAAVKEYTKDGANGTFSILNRALRSGKRERYEELNELQRATDKNLEQLFDTKTGTTGPIRLYRGISRGHAYRITRDKFYMDNGWSSASTSLAVALAYTGDDRRVAIIDLPQGYPAAALAKISYKPHEAEVLLQKDCVFPKQGKHLKVKIEGDEREYVFLHFVYEGGKDDQ